MNLKMWRLLILVFLPAMGWAASASSLKEEVTDISDEISALAEAVPEHPFEERNLLGSEVRVTLPQLRDRLDEVRERLQDETTPAPSLEDVALVQWELKDLETKVRGIDLIEDEPTFLVLRGEMQQGLDLIHQHMKAVTAAFQRSENAPFAH